MDYAGCHKINDGKEEVFVFTAKPRCSSSRAHLGGSIVLVVPGIPGLKKPLLSVPVSLQARFRPGKQKGTKNAATGEGNSSINKPAIEKPTSHNKTTMETRGGLMGSPLKLKCAKKPDIPLMLKSPSSCAPRMLTLTPSVYYIDEENCSRIPGYCSQELLRYVSRGSP